ncbi:hypothetical protein [Paenibacillus sp. SYP-B4298]|uniref:hypothetical protein n=1 Tax=Paenibacillus sp. SYP-B4298 TaxID=2996034 RepID=UPI0022DE7391|nr:hypothetical protein [Paenibacillus sp. SYP-B4298]
MISHTKKFIAAAALGAVMITGAAHAATDQFADTNLPALGSFAESSNINGNPTGHYGGWLNTQRGTMKIAAKRVVRLWPDTTISNFNTNTTNVSYAQINMDPDTDLYYVRLTPVSNGPSGYGFIQNY